MNGPKPNDRGPLETENLRSIYIYDDSPVDTTVRPLRPNIPRPVLPEENGKPPTPPAQSTE